MLLEDVGGLQLGAPKRFAQKNHFFLAQNNPIPLRLTIKINHMGY